MNGGIARAGSHAAQSAGRTDTADARRDCSSTQRGGIKPAAKAERSAHAAAQAGGRADAATHGRGHSEAAAHARRRAERSHRRCGTETAAAKATHVATAK